MTSNNDNSPCSRNLSPEGIEHAAPAFQVEPEYDDATDPTTTVRPPAPSTSAQRIRSNSSYISASTAQRIKSIERHIEETPFGRACRGLDRRSVSPSPGAYVDAVAIDSRVIAAKSTNAAEPGRSPSAGKSPRHLRGPGDEEVPTPQRLKTSPISPYCPKESPAYIVYEDHIQQDADMPEVPQFNAVERDSYVTPSKATRRTRKNSIRKRFSSADSASGDSEPAGSKRPPRPSPIRSRPARQLNFAATRNPPATTTTRATSSDGRLQAAPQR